MFPVKRARERLIARLEDDAFSDPLPKLRLGGPKLFPIAADDKRGLLFLFLLIFVFLTHLRFARRLDTPVPLRGFVLADRKKSRPKEATHDTP